MELLKLSKEMKELNKNWVYYLTRPFSLLGASLWYRWYNNDLIKKQIGTGLSSALFIEEHPGVMRRYAINKELIKYKEKINSIINKPPKTRELLERGIKLNKKAKKIIKSKSELSLEEAIAFFVDMAFHATIFPYFAYETLNNLNKNKGSKSLRLAEKLRGESYYYDFLNKIIIPLAKNKLNIKNNDINFLTIDEVIKGSTQNIEKRKKLQLKGSRYFYCVYNNKETIQLIKRRSIEEIISKLEKIKSTKKLTGMTAFPGKVRGVVSLVLTNNIKSIKFNKGDILVAPTTNPVLLPLFKKCSAIITDEGGMTSHAAILSRELRKPCIVGTKIASKVLRNGDIIEVDANNGVINIIKK